MKLEDELLGKGYDELLEYVQQQCEERGIEFDVDNLDNKDRQGLIDFIADHLVQGMMPYHSECNQGDFGSMHPNETEEEFYEHEGWD